MPPFSSGPDGVLPRQDIIEMAKAGVIRSEFTIDERQSQPASLDLRLGEVAHRVQCSFLPGEETVQEKLKRYTIHSLSLVHGAVLEPSTVYVIPLAEELKLPEEIRAKANPRSSTGRLDIFTRVITDRSDRFDEIKEGYRGPLYLEVLSRSFPIRVERRMSLCQLRFIRGDCRCPEEDITRLYKMHEPLLY